MHVKITRTGSFTLYGDPAIVKTVLILPATSRKKKLMSRQSF